MEIKFRSALRSLGIGESLVEKTADINVSIGGLVEFLLAINFNNWNDLDKAIDENLVDNRINEINTKLDSIIKSILTGNGVKSPVARSRYAFDPFALEDAPDVSKPIIPVKERTIKSKKKEKSKPSRVLYSGMGPEIQKWIDENKPKTRSAIAKQFGCAPSTVTKLLDTGIIKCTFPDINIRKRKERFTDYVEFSDVEKSRIHKINEIVEDSGLSNKRPNVFNKLYTRLRDIYGIVFEDIIKQIKYKYNLVPLEDYPDPSKLECIACDDQIYDIAEALLYTICEEMS